jgi:hypothetical protein
MKASRKNGFTLRQRSGRALPATLASSWILLVMSVAPALCQQAMTKKSYASPLPPPPPPSIHIDLQPLGYRVPKTAAPYELSPPEGLYFVDADHILITFRIADLMQRLPDCPPGDEDRTIHAVVLELPSGRITAAANWRLHDHLQYLWPLSGGRFLVRQRNRLMVTDPSMKLHPFLRPVSRLESVQVSQDGKMLIVETEMERHSAEDHIKIVQQAHDKKAPSPPEDVRVMVVDTEKRSVIAESREPRSISLHLIRDGYVETVPHHWGRWELRYVPFAGIPKSIAAFGSKCEPKLDILNSDAVLVTNCPTANGGNGVMALSLEGKPLWTVGSNRNLAVPRFTSSTDGGAVVLSRLKLANPVDMQMPTVKEANIVGQQIDLFDAASGKIRLEASAWPVRVYGQDYALSPDGQKLAVLKTDKVEIFDVQPAPTPSEPVSPGRE